MKNNRTLYLKVLLHQKQFEKETLINYLNLAESKLSENKLSESILAGFLLLEAKEDTI